MFDTMVLEKEAKDIINKFIEEELELVENKLKSISSDDGFINNVSKYLFEKKGKRVRAKLLILSYLSCANGSDYTRRINDVVSITAVVEMLHTASLIHDDVIDGSDIRRGRDTVNSIWGNKISTLMGDYLYARAATMMSDIGDNDILRVITNATGDMCEGEIAQVNGSFKSEVSEDKYIDIITKKTASLFGASCEAGAILAETDKYIQDKMRNFGINLGISFQIIDDIMDIVSDNGDIGKPVGSDLKEGKITLPYIHVLETGSNEHKKTIIDCMGKNDGFKKVREILDGYNSINYARDRAISYINTAKNSLNGISDSSAKDELIKISDFVVTRTY